ncbi:hypothetical protein QA645_33680 [Bradyrhizobium sp. CIAT3101]|uniref:hypothetical protein n=1 Tax=Bradyrhizobium sp. CIAT3101 TaxID=439387 RepID=UPI0024B1BEA3|nr:hypothetical protein [Bradyrhizobium sp. CIAT3101]WFU79408.1 hypothetical protein QA645_33680 [Bradyrhizobium sp. CIAT3101]
MTPDQLADVDNGIWTCELHGKDIDNNKGNAFPAGLLRTWKRLHEARIRRASTGAPLDRWIEQVKLKRSPLFLPDSVMHFGRVTVVSGTNGAGKTAICEWLAGLRNTRLLNRWDGTNARRALNLDLSFMASKDHTLSMDIPVDGMPQFELDGAAQPESPSVIDFVYLPHRYLDPRMGDDLRGLAELLQVNVATVVALAANVGANGNKRFRHMGFEPKPLEPEDPPESVQHEDGSPHMELIAETYSPAERFPLKNFGGGVHTEVLLALAAELARFKSQHLPTMLVLEGAGWGFAKDLFDQVADAIDQCAKHCQVLFIEPHNRLDEDRMRAREWVHYEIEVPHAGRGSPRLPATLRMC